MSTPRSKTPPEAVDDQPEHKAPADQEPGTNATQHEPDPKADPQTGEERKYHPRSPYTTGNY